MTAIRSIATGTVCSVCLLAACSGKPAEQTAAVTQAPAAANQPVASHATPGGESPQLPPGHPPLGATQVDTTVTAPIPPPAGGMTIASLWANRRTLAGKTVSVRGKVVKFNGGILGLNWTHLQDGSGVATDGTNDITITSAAEARLGDVITVTGTVVLDKDFGAGYTYKVILQNATLAVK